MAFVYDTVTIGGTDYDVYEDITGADLYLAADPARFTAWAALSTDEKGRALVASTRRHERLRLQGEKTDEDNTFQMPRSGLIDKEGEAVDSATLPDAWLSSVILLAADIAADTDLQDQASTADNNRRIRAGSVEIERFGPTKGTKLPTPNQELIGHFLEGARVKTGTAGGTSTSSTFSDADRWGLCEGYS